MTRLFAACTGAILLAVAAPAAAQTADHTATDETVTNPDDGTTIAITIFKPAGASADAQAPVILHSHGWAGSREDTIDDDTKPFLDAGFGVVSFDQRGHGDSSGQANVQDPTMETEDVKAVIDRIAQLDWVLHDTDASGTPIANDPVLGAIGASYGGGYQTMTTFDEIADDGGTRFDALAPEITWYDLPESLAPQKVVRTAWDALLYAAGAGMVPQYIHEANTWGAATGQWPDGTVYGEPVQGVPDLDSEFHEHSPVAFVEQGFRIGIPMLLRQGTSDNLFNLNEGLGIFDKALSDDAREQSFFVGYNGGHALPNVVPPGSPTAFELGGGVDACSDDWTQKRIEFFRRAFAGESTEGLYPTRYNLTELGGEACLHMDSFDASDVSVEPPGGSVVSTSGLGAPLHIQIAQGPTTVTGVPELSGLVTALGLDSRAFFGLSVGTTPADVRVVQNNLLPLRQILPGVNLPFEIELPGVAVEVAEGQSLFLTISPVSDMYIGHGSRTPGGLVLSDLTVSLPEPGAAKQPQPTALELRVDGRGSSARLVATLTEAESGDGIPGAPIEFFADGSSLGIATTDGDGVASMPLQGRNRGGRHTFEAIFGGNDDFEGSAASTG